MDELCFREGGTADTATLDSMTLAGARHWGHDRSNPVAYRGLEHWLAVGEPSEMITVAEVDGVAVGFYGLVVESDYIELRRLSVDVERIGTGLGRRLWQHAVAEARTLGRWMRVLSDPGACGFYETMGAVFAETWEAHPGFEYSVYWFDLNDHHP